MHRLWYDLRAQALFESAFRDDVTAIDKSLEDMVWRIMSRYAGLGGKQIAAFERFEPHLALLLAVHRLFVARTQIEPLPTFPKACHGCASQCLWRELAGEM